jgi:hypothetical protein
MSRRTKLLLLLLFVVADALIAGFAAGSLFPWHYPPLPLIFAANILGCILGGALFAYLIWSRNA